jgi:hypothetical protein
LFSCVQCVIINEKFSLILFALIKWSECSL